MGYALLIGGGNHLPVDMDHDTFVGPRSYDDCRDSTLEATTEDHTQRWRRPRDFVTTDPEGGFFFCFRMLVGALLRDPHRGARRSEYGRT